jgi:hypothetical protein
MVRELIRREFGVRLSETSVGRLLRRLGFSPQRPLHRASGLRAGSGVGGAVAARGIPRDPAAGKG